MDTRDTIRQAESLNLSDIFGESENSVTEEGSRASESESSSKKKKSLSSSSFSSSTESGNLESIGQLDWETHVHQNLPGLMDMDQDERIVWPRDSLFRYFELLEKLQYNLEERKGLQEFAGMDLGQS
uniref:Uncharacterized protein n=1 Tax=Molossus molossus TaxID=27622 RepID=A0A7J8JVR7_MOLMO|nr:hypothetical protein HJG59_008003 [Molossus molossus]